MTESHAQASAPAEVTAPASAAAPATAAPVAPVDVKPVDKKDEGFASAKTASDGSSLMHSLTSAAGKMVGDAKEGREGKLFGRDEASGSLVILGFKIRIAEIILVLFVLMLWFSISGIAGTLSDTGRRQARAYVYPVKCIREGGHQGHMRFHMLVRNFGQTPAYSCVVTFNTALAKFPAKRLKARGKADKVTGLHLPPQGEELVAQHNVIDLGSELEEVTAGNMAVYVFGTIHYRDAFKIKRTTNFRYYYSDTSIESGEMIADETGNDAT